MKKDSIKLLLYCFCAIICIAFSACVSQSMMNAINSHYYKYSFAIRERTSRKMPATYSDNNFTVSFNPRFIRVDYTVENHSTQPIAIHWENAYLVIHEDSSKVITQDIELRYADEVPKPLEIAPAQTLKGFVVPVDYIRNSDTGWTAREFYPSHDDSMAVKTDWIMGLIGVDIFKLYIPVTVNGQTEIHKFTFYPNEMEKSPVSLVPKQ